MYLRFLTLVFCLASCPLFAITVMNTNDTGLGSFRDCVENAFAGEVIDFDFSLGGSTIILNTAVIISQSITIDGTLLGTGNQVTIKGSSTNFNGLEITSFGALIKGIRIEGFRNGISLNSGGFNTIEGNIIGGNELNGILITNASADNVIIGNKIGVDVNGTTPFPNQQNGIQLEGPGANTIESNIIGGNVFNGIRIIGSENNVIKDNHIGVDDSETIPLPNVQNGILFSPNTSNHVIVKNVIGYNQLDGIRIANASVSGIRITENSILCNLAQGINLQFGGNGFTDSPIIESVTATNTPGVFEISGIAPTNCMTVDCILEFFDTDNCLINQGKDFIHNSSIVISGFTWTVELPITGPFVVTATLSNNLSTSEFSPPWIVALPIQLEYFKGTAHNGVNILEWETSSQVNNGYFSILRSEDGVRYSLLETIAGKGNSVEVDYYSVIDEDLERPLYYYKLRQTDFDGHFIDSEIISIRNERINPALNMYPNPANDLVNLSFSSLVVGELQLQDLAGKIIDRKELKQSMTVDVSDLSEGVYFLMINDGQQIKSQKLMVKH